MCTHPHTHRAELLQPSIPVWLERQMVSLSAHQLPRGAGGGSICVRLYDCRRNGEGAVVCLQRERKKRFPQECAWTHSHMSTHTHTAGGCQNVLQKLSCVQFSLLHPLCSFILSPPFIYLYPFAHPLIAQQPCSSPPLLLSSRWEWKKTLRLRTWLSTLHAQPEERKHKSTSIKIIGGEHLLIQPAAMRGCVCESLSTIGRAAGLHHTEEGLNIKHPFFSLKQWNVQQRQHWLLGSDL